MKKIIALLLCLVMVAGIMPAAFAEGSIEPEKEISVLINSESAQSIQYGADYNWTHVVGDYGQFTYTYGGVEVKASWKTSNSKVVSVDSSGNWKALKQGTATITGTYAGNSLTAKITVQFWDVTNKSDYYYTPVYWAAGKGITGGYNGEYFGVGYACTRGDMLTFMWRLAGKPNPASMRNPFPDVSSDDYFYKPVLWAYHKGITNGYSSDGCFHPEYSCTREQAMTFLWRMKGKPAPKTTSSPFSDVYKGDYYYKAVLWAAEKGIAKGYDDGTYGVGYTCLREHMVTFLYRYSKL